MLAKIKIPIFILFLFLISCATSKVEKIDYNRLIRNTTFSDVHRNPKVIENEYFEFKATTFTYGFARKNFKDNYFRRSAYQGIFVVLGDELLLTVQKALFCDREVVGKNQVSKKEKNTEETTEDDENKCTYSYYDIKLLESMKLIERGDVSMPKRFKIAKTVNTLKIMASDKHKGKVYEAKDPLTY